MHSIVLCIKTYDNNIRSVNYKLIFFILKIIKGSTTVKIILGRQH